MKNNKNIAALVLAAGSSARAPGFKPLLPLGKGTVIEAAINVFSASGVEDIVVVTGHRADELAPMLDRLGVRQVRNETYQEGMFSSVLAGVKSLRPETDAFFLLPADMPLVRSHTITRLRKACLRTTADVIYPVFQRLRGHPPLISANCIPAILSWDRPGGLRSLLLRDEQTARNVDVMDEGILIDVDTAEDYQSAVERFALGEIPRQREIDAMLDAVMTPESVIRHCRMVSEIGRLMGEALNRAGSHLDVELIAAGGMLHDMAKGRLHHARTGARMLLAMGYPNVAKIVAAHHATDFMGGQPDEASVLFLADKLVLEDRIVSLDERFSECLMKYANDATVLHEVEHRLVTARIIRKTVEKMIGMKLEDLIRGKGYVASWTINKEVVQG